VKRNNQMPFKINYNEEECIGCGACTVQCPENWELVEKNGLFKAKPKQTNLSDIGKNKEAEEVCPVNCIKISEE